MKKISIKILLGFYSFFTFTFACAGCSENPNRVPFDIIPGYTLMCIHVQLNDSITANMIYDSGAVDGIFRLDSVFAAKHPSVIPNVQPTPYKLHGTAWHDTKEYVLNHVYDVSQAFKIGDTQIKYNSINLYDMQRFYGKNDIFNGIFNIPKNDSINVWEWNFEHNYLEIHPSEGFVMPEDCLLFPFERIGYYDYYIKMPLTIHFSDGDSLKMNETFFIDTGNASDITIVYPAAELEFLKSKEDVIWYKFGSYDFFRKYNANITLSNGYRINSVDIYTSDKAYRVASKYTLGLNFVKHFNMFIDRKKRLIGLQPINNFNRVHSAEEQLYYYSKPNKEGKYLVTMIADYKSNNFKNAGLVVGDQIIATNGVLMKNITLKQEVGFLEADTITLDILRKGEPIRLTVPVVNKMPKELIDGIKKHVEKQGD